MNYNENDYKEKAKLFKTIRIILICVALSPIIIIIMMFVMMAIQTILN